MTLLPSVYLFGQENNPWAVDEDFRLTRESLEPLVAFRTLTQAEVVHATWWPALLALDSEALRGKKILCHQPSDPVQAFRRPAFRYSDARVGLYLARSKGALARLQAFGRPVRLLPYVVDTRLFYPLGDDEPQALRERWSIPEDRYLLGNFNRDSLGVDLRQFKPEKGADVFAMVVHALHQEGLPIHVVLAGPRRHYLLRRLTHLGVPFTYVGQVHDQDDMTLNTLERGTLNVLYNLLDLCLVTSRWEGGPHAILEASAARCKIISTHVGQAPDVLEPYNIADDPASMVELIREDIRHHRLEASLEIHAARVQAHYTLTAHTAYLHTIYADLDDVPVFSGEARPVPPAPPPHRAKSLSKRLLRRALGRPQGKPMTVGLWHTFRRPPWGGGNQFMLALRRGLVQRGLRVVNNEIGPHVDVHVVNSIWFDRDHLLQEDNRDRVRIVHRLDGPIHMMRGTDYELDELDYQINRRWANATVVQSAWVLEQVVSLGFKLVEPTIVHNTVNSNIFHPRGRIPFDPSRKIRVVSTSWSNNPRKGGAIYRWLEDNLDWDRFTYTHIGRTSEPLRRARHIQPLPSRQLAHQLRQHDIYLAASYLEACSNALLEAMACGLPVLTPNSSSYPELVRLGGLHFAEKEAIPQQLERIATHYDLFQQALYQPSYDEVIDQYLAIIEQVSERS